MSKIQNMKTGKVINIGKKPVPKLKPLPKPQLPKGGYTPNPFYTA